MWKSYILIFPHLFIIFIITPDLFLFLTYKTSWPVHCENMISWWKDQPKWSKTYDDISVNTRNMLLSTSAHQQSSFSIHRNISILTSTSLEPTHDCRKNPPCCRLAAVYLVQSGGWASPVRWALTHTHRRPHLSGSWQPSPWHMEAAEKAPVLSEALTGWQILLLLLKVRLTAWVMIAQFSLIQLAKLRSLSWASFKSEIPVET